MVRQSIKSLGCLFLILAAMAQVAEAVRPSDLLLPNTTKGYISIPDIELFEKKWDETQFGRLLKDPKMQSFSKDLEGQITSKLNKAGAKLSITIGEIRAIAGGEVCFARIQPNNDKTKHAVALLVDVTDHMDEANKLLTKVAKNLTDRGGRHKTIELFGQKVVSFTLPKEKGAAKGSTVFYTIYQNQLIAADHESTCGDLIARMVGHHNDVLANVPAYREAMDRTSQAAGDLVPHLRWYVDPFGYFETNRAERGMKKRGTDYLDIFSSTGFRVIQGAGGVVVLAPGEQEILHHSFIFAPGEKELGAKMLDFPNSHALTPQKWVLRKGAMYATFKWNLKEAFWASKWPINKIAGDPTIFDEVLKSIKKDPAGPQIDIEKELINHLSDRVTMIIDYRLPVTTKSERFCVAVELKNPAVVAKTVKRAMEHDPQAKKRIVGRQIIWEIIEAEETDDDDDFDVPAIDGVPGLGPLGFEDEEEDEGGDQGSLPSSAVAVVNGHLLIASHVDYIAELLKRLEKKDTIGESADYHAVTDMLEKLGAGNNSFRMFMRLDEAFRANYELMKAGKLGESETIQARILNAFIGSGEDGKPRKQQIDGTKLPEYQIVRRYLGPAGSFVKTVDNGWFITGCFLSKDMQ